MNQIEALKAFCAVCNTGSFVAAGQSLNVSSTMISRYVRQLEDELGCLLLKRNTRQVHITHAGQHYFDQVSPVLTSLKKINDNMMQFSSVPKGKLTVSSSVEFGGQYLAPVIERFRKKYPDVDVEIILSNQPEDIWDAKIDLALRIAPNLPGASFIAQKICQSRLALWANPSYLKRAGKPLSIDDLEQHQLLFFQHSIRSNQWLIEKDGIQKQMTFSWAWRSNNGRILNEAAADGAGIIQAPSYSVADYVAKGKLIEVLPEYSLKELAISAVYPHSFEYSLNIKLFVNELKQYFKEYPVA